MRRPLVDADDSKQPAQTWNHFGEIVRPDLLWRWTIEKNPTFRYFQQALRDWDKRRADPSRRPLCLTCDHAFRPGENMPSAWMFVRVSVSKAGVPRQLILVGICEECTANDDARLLREGCADLRRAFPDMPEFKVHVVQEALVVVN